MRKVLELLTVLILLTSTMLATCGNASKKKPK